MVLFEKMNERKTELVAMCEMCESPVQSAQDCYVDHSRLTSMCVTCFHHIPSLEETEQMVAKLRAYQKLWAGKKELYQSFISVAKEVNLPLQTPETVCLEALSVADVQGSG